jgi:hypothetical protein
VIFAKIGDSLESDVKQPLPGILKSRLDTKEAVAMANELLSNSNETGYPSMAHRCSRGNLRQTGKLVNSVCG